MTDLTRTENATLVPTKDVQASVDVYIANRNYIVEKIKPLLIEGVDVYTLPGMNKPSLGKPGAEKLAAFFGLSAEFSVDKETMDAIGSQANGKQYIAYICDLKRHGLPAGQGRGATFVEYMRNSYQMVFSQPAGTPEKDGWKGPFQGKSKTTGNPYQFWKIPEPPVFDPLALNKAIKMAQKSAFVDAVIRTTGMSDLFTQDIEDMAEPSVAPEVAETKPEAKPIINKDGTVDDAFAPTSAVADAFKTCPICNAKHQGRFPKCYACWKAEQPKK